ncbi:MAG: hypothetical protein LKM37_00560 [Bacteroidales bacterium]|jgi:hypothetical protein|nr:hypothetical protein [Bacteroidales bacterium]
MENSQGKNFPRLFFQLKILNAKISHGFFQWEKFRKAKFSAQQIFARAERVPPRGGSRVNHTLPARFVRW